MLSLFLNMLTVLGAITFFWGVVKLFFYSIRAPVLEGRFLPWLRIVYQIFPPYQIVRLPRDYWYHRLCIPLDLSVSDREYQGKFQHRYIGAYEIRLNVEKPVPTQMPKYEIGAHFTISFSVDGKPVSTFELGDELLTAVGPSGYFGLLVYKVPKDLPRRVPIHCKVKVHLHNDTLARDYGGASLSIRKFSDL